jgi:hypothetical protein
MQCAQVFELVKNSLRAVNERYQDSDDLPPNIRVVVAEGGEDVTIKVRRVHTGRGPHLQLMADTEQASRMTKDISRSPGSLSRCCSTLFGATVPGLCAAVST